MLVFNKLTENQSYKAMQPRPHILPPPRREA